MIERIREKLELNKKHKRRKKKYGRNRQKEERSIYGQRSCIFAGVEIALLVIIVLISYLCKGNAVIYIGVAGIMTMMVSGLGISAGLNGLRERGKAHFTSRLGVILNAAVLVIFAVLFLGGLF